MTTEEVQALVCTQSAENLDAMSHGIALKDALVAPRLISVIARNVRNGRLKDENILAWLVGQEKQTDGYKIILSDDGSKFGLASKGFPHDVAPILAGWYGNLLDAFLGM